LKQGSIFDSKTKRISNGGPDSSLPQNHFRDHSAGHPERQISRIAQDGHFKDMEPLNKGDGISPLCKAPIVPHLPEEPANQGSQGATQDAPPVSRGKGGENGGLSHEGLKRNQDEQGGYPDKSVEMIGPDTESGKSCSSRTKGQNRPKPGKRESDGEKSGKVLADAGKGPEPFPGAHDRGQHRGKGEGGIKKIFPGSEADSCVLPVLDESVQVLEKPPEGGACREEQEKTTRPIKHQASPGAVKGQGVGKEDIGEPKRCERVGLKRVEPGEAGPGQNPSAKAHGRPKSAPPGKASRSTYGRGRDARLSHALKDKRRDTYSNKEGVTGKGPPGKRRTMDKHRGRRKFEIRGKGFAAQHEAKDREPENHENQENDLKDFFAHEKKSSIPAFPPGRAPHGPVANGGQTPSSFINHPLKWRNPFFERFRWKLKASSGTIKKIVSL